LPSLNKRHISHLDILLIGRLLAMLSKQRILEHLHAFVEGRESLDSFEDWLAAESVSLRRDSDRALISLVAQVMHSIDLHSDNSLSDVLIRSDLLDLLRSEEVQEFEIRFAFEGDPEQPLPFVEPKPHPSVNSESQNQAVAAAVAAFG
jgi:hypothetical protein